MTKVNGHAAWTGKVELIESKLLEPLSWKKPARVFVNSMSDLFHEALPDEAIDRVFAVMAFCPHLTFQVLTKRPNRMLEYLSGEREDWIAQAVESRNWTPPLDDWPLRNVHLGVSVEDQKTADERIPLLLQTPAAKRFVSYEPALGPVDFTPYVSCKFCADMQGVAGAPCTCPTLDQIIVGGESGPGARPFDIAWARQTIQQCKVAGVACFVKQLGAQPYEEVTRQDVTPHPVYGDEVVCTEPAYLRLKDRKGGDMEEWSPELRVRELI